MAKTIYLISVGKITNKNLKSIIEEYIKRVSPFFEIIQKEIKEFGFSDQLEIEKEGEKILSLISDDSFIIVCDQNGEKLNSDLFFAKLDKSIQSFKSVTIVIGGAYGLSSKVKQKSNLILSLSPMTFTHQTARFVIVEQIYRYCMFKENHPFVK